MDTAFFILFRRPARARRDDEMKAAIKHVHDASHGLYSTRKVWHQLDTSKNPLFPA